MAMRMARFALGGRTEYGRDVVVTFDIRFRSKVQVTTICLGFTRESVLQVGFGLAAFQ